MQQKIRSILIPSILIFCLLSMTGFIACSSTSAPTAVTLSAPRYDLTTSKATLTWTVNADDNFKEYKIYRSDATGVDETATLLATIDTQATTTYDDSFDTKPDKYYYYKVYVGNGSKTTGSNEEKLTGLYLPTFSFGSCGSGDGEFDYPGDVAVDTDGNIFVADSSNCRIQKFDSAGTYISQWGTCGSGDNQFNSPYNLNIGPDGLIYVSDNDNNRIQIFDTAGTFINKFDTPNDPGDCFVSSDGTIYVPLFETDDVKIYDSSFTLTDTWGSSGSGDGQLSGPWDIDASPDGNTFYVLDQDNQRVEVFSKTGEYVSQFANSGDGQCSDCWALAVDHYGYVYTTDWSLGKVMIYDASGNFLDDFVIPGSSWGIWDLTFDKDNNLYVVDADNCVVYVYGP